MKKLLGSLVALTAMLLIGGCSGGGGDVIANSTGFVNIAIPDNDPAGIHSTLSLNGTFGTVAKVTVTVNITHTYDADVDIYLTSADGTTIVLARDVGGSGDDFIATVFDDDAPQSIILGTAPFAGDYQPEDPLSIFNGENVDGFWTLNVVDDLNGEIGTLDSWSIEVEFN